MGDDDSGPEDHKDDEDLECEIVKMITFRLALDSFLLSKSPPKTTKSVYSQIIIVINRFSSPIDDNSQNDKFRKRRVTPFLLSRAIFVPNKESG